MENELGKKHICQSCGVKFYDLMKPEPACPKCGQVVDEEIEEIKTTAVGSEPDDEMDGKDEDTGDDDDKDLGDLEDDLSYEGGGDDTLEDEEQ